MANPNPKVHPRQPFTGKSENLKYAKCKLCNKRFYTMQTIKTHFGKVHPKIALPKYGREYYCQYDYGNATKSKAKPKAKPSPKPQAVPAGMTELVVPVYIKIPLVIGQPVIIEPVLGKEKT